jgi:hypothetical protein
VREGTLFEFSTPEEIVAAAKALRALGLARLVAYTPYALPELDEPLGLRRTRIPWAVLVGAAIGCAAAFLILWGTNAYDYPIDVGGRPMNSLPADVPILFETTVLFGGFTAFVLPFVRSGMPRLYTETLCVPGIESATLDRFWLGVEGAPPLASDVQERMLALGALRVRTVGGGE